MSHHSGVLQLRVVLTTREYATLVDFYCAGLGLEPAESWTHDGGHGLLLEMGEASLEVFDEPYARFVDGVEVGENISGPIRLALHVPDVVAAVDRLVQHGGALVHAPVVTPWGDINARVEAPDGLQVTLFQPGQEP